MSQLPWCYSGYFEYHQHKNKFKKISTSKIFSGYIQSKIIHDYHIGILTTLIRKKYLMKLEDIIIFFIFVEILSLTLG